MNEQQQIIEPTPIPLRGSNGESILMVGVIGVFIGALLGYVAYPIVNATDTISELTSENDTSYVISMDDVSTSTTAPAPQEVDVVEESTAAESSVTSKEEDAFCNEYGTFAVAKNDLFEKYTIGPGETLRDVARKTLKDETKAVTFVAVNPQLQGFEIDDALPMGLSIYIPDERYTQEGITAYVKTRGNITFNETKPMFGVNAPNSGTGPFTISEGIKTKLVGIEEGDCVEVIYGSRGYDPQKVVLEVNLQ